MSNAFCVSIEIIVIFIFHFVSVVYNMEWFVHVEQSLCPWNKFHIFTVYKHFNVLLNLPCLYSVENFASVSTRDINLYFSFDFLMWCRYDSFAGLVIWVWHASSSVFGKSWEEFLSILVWTFHRNHQWSCQILNFCLVKGFRFFNSSCLIVIGVFSFSVSLWFSFGRLYVSRNLPYFF